MEEIKEKREMLLPRSNINTLEMLTTLVAFIRGNVPIGKLFQFATEYSQTISCNHDSSTVYCTYTK